MSTSLLLHHKYLPCWKHCFPWIESDSTYACAYECHSRRFLLSSLALAEKLISSPPSPASRLAAITERPFSLLVIFHLSLLKSPWIHLLGLKVVCLQEKKKKKNKTQICILGCLWSGIGSLVIFFEFQFLICNKGKAKMSHSIWESGIK